MGTSGLKKILRVAIVSERRADYSRFKPILALMKRDPFFDYRLIVTGVSLLKQHGEDIRIIREDGFKIAAVIPMYRQNSPDTGAEMARAIARVKVGLANIFERMRPDIILAGFDIGANFAAAVVGAHMNIPVAHIQGGEVTGSIDESLRHATSKFAHIHFPTTADAARRLMRMGEDPRFIFPVGCTSIDTLLASPRMPRQEIARILNLGPSEPYALIVQHPVTTEARETARQFIETIQGVRLADIAGIIIYPNHDAGYRAIIQGIQRSRIRWYKGFRPEIFANLLRHAAVLVGNSSTGIHEAATFRVPVVNIGTRQQGRARPHNVIDVGYDRHEIAAAIHQALGDPAFRRKLARVRNIYGDGKAAPRIVRILKRLDLSKVPIQKRFVD